MQVGFIGLGAMGVPMARNLSKSGLLRRVWNRTAARAVELAQELHCSTSSSLPELVVGLDAVVMCVSADADMLAVIEAITPALTAGQIIIDCSTVNAASARQAAHRVQQRQAGFLDAPVSGGVEGAKAGSLAIMVGGHEADVTRAMPVLSAMGSTVTYFGPSGAGQAAKATNQIMVAGITRAVAEAMAFAAAQGLALDKVIATLSRGAGSSWTLINRGPNMLRGSYPAGFRVRLHDKDLKICREMAGQLGVTLPVVEETLADYAQLIKQGFGDEDVSSLHRLKTALFAGSRGS